MKFIDALSELRTCVLKDMKSHIAKEHEEKSLLDHMKINEADIVHFKSYKIDDV